MPAFARHLHWVTVYSFNPTFWVHITCWTPRAGLASLSRTKWIRANRQQRTKRTESKASEREPTRRQITDAKYSEHFRDLRFPAKRKRRSVQTNNPLPLSRTLPPPSPEFFRYLQAAPRGEELRPAHFFPFDPLYDLRLLEPLPVTSRPFVPKSRNAGGYRACCRCGLRRWRTRGERRKREGGRARDDGGGVGRARDGRSRNSPRGGGMKSRWVNFRLRIIRAGKL